MQIVYKRPPIVEAVFAIGIKSALDDATADKVQRRLSDHYSGPVQRVVSQFDIEITDKGPRIKGSQSAAYKLVSLDAADVVLIFPEQIITSRLAPYEGWDALFARARANWDTWKKIAGYRQISRIGVRYVNRVDIPTATENTVRLEDYFTVTPRLPTGAGIPTMHHFSVNVTAPMAEGFRLILNTGSTPSPLLKTASFLLDIDISMEGNLPSNDEGIWEAFSQIHNAKNLVFESCITDQTRALFA